jgi:alpha/beta superfamily hydrolase
MRKTLTMDPDMNTAKEARAFAVLLHPHPHFGGNRFHPFIDALFHRLANVAVGAVRFDFSSADLSVARGEASAAIDAGEARWPEVPALLVGYSFGAGVAAGVDDKRIAGWYLLAPPAEMLSHTTIGSDPRPKALVVPQNDQFSPPAAIAEVVVGWETTTVTTLPDNDHFLGAIQPIVDSALGWIEAMTSE